MVSLSRLFHKTDEREKPATAATAPAEPACAPTAKDVYKRQAHYWVRLARARESVDDTCSQQIGALATQVREVQEKAADAIHEKGGYDLSLIHI